MHSLSFGQKVTARNYGRLSLPPFTENYFNLGSAKTSKTDYVFAIVEDRLMMGRFWRIKKTKTITYFEEIKHNITKYHPAKNVLCWWYYDQKNQWVEVKNS